MKKNILIVDNDIDFIGLVSETLQSKGYVVASARDSKEGLKRIQDNGPDLILLDVILKHKLEGIDMVKRLKSNSATKNIPIVIVTGIRKEFNLPFGLEEDKERFPVNVVIEKPINPELLLKTIENILNNN